MSEVFDKIRLDNTIRPGLGVSNTTKIKFVLQNYTSLPNVKKPVN